MSKFKRKYKLHTKLGDQHGYTHAIYTVVLFRKILGIFVPVRRYSINCLLNQPFKSSYKLRPPTHFEKRIPNQDEENAKYHLDINGIKTKYEEDFDPYTFNNMNVKEQLEFTKERFPIGMKVYTNLNCKPTECTVLGYELKDSGSCDVCNILTDYNEIQNGYNYKHEGNTSMHPGWFYPKSNRENNLEALLNI